MENAIKTLETSLAEREAAIRILQSKSSAASNLTVNNLDEIIKMSLQAQPPSATPQTDNILNIPIMNSTGNSPQKKQFQMPSVLATPPQYHSLNLSKKLGHAHRSLTPSADMFLRAERGANTEYIRSATPSADILRAAPSSIPSDVLRATPTNVAEFLKAANAAEQLQRGRSPTSTDMHRLSAPADILRATPTSIEMLRATPTSAEMLRVTANADMFSRANHPPPASMAELLHQQQQQHRSSAPPSSISAAHFDIMRATPSSHAEASLKRREPSGTSTGADSFQHPGPT
jgi:hypothetical protein